MSTEPKADEDMVKDAVDEHYEELSRPPHCEAPKDHRLWPLIEAALREVYDPEIPVSVYELGLIYKVDIAEEKDGKFDLFVLMTLTSPGCPVAQEMPGWVQGALLPIEDVGGVEVEIIWDPPWDPSMMAETAKLQLNMYM